MIPGASCDTCCFWQLVPAIQRRDGVRIGECRRRAPKLVQTADARLHSNFPKIAENEWCGDHAICDTEDGD